MSLSGPIWLYHCINADLLTIYFDCWSNSTDNLFRLIEHTLRINRVCVWLCLYVCVCVWNISWQCVDVWQFLREAVTLQSWQANLGIMDHMCLVCVLCWLYLSTLLLCFVWPRDTKRIFLVVLFLSVSLFLAHLSTSPSSCLPASASLPLSVSNSAQPCPLIRWLLSKRWRLLMLSNTTVLKQMYLCCVCVSYLWRF